jgi:hypothetical protein
MDPARTETDAEAANDEPWSRARKNTIGAEVSGSPMSQPLIVDPHLRPTRLAIAINVGVKTIFRIRVSIQSSSGTKQMVLDQTAKQYFRLSFAGARCNSSSQDLAKVALFVSGFTSGENRSFSKMKVGNLL